MGKLVVAHAERRAQRTLQQLAGATLSPVEVVADERALMAAVDPDTIAIVDIALAQANPGLRDRPARAWIAVPGEGAEPAEAETVARLTPGDQNSFQWRLTQRRVGGEKLPDVNVRFRRAGESR